MESVYSRVKKEHTTKDCNPFNLVWPHEAIATIVSSVMDNWLSISNNKFTYLENCTELSTERNSIYFVNNATDIAVYNNNHRLLAITRPPFIAGAGSLFSYNVPVFVKFRTPSPVLLANKDDFYSLAETAGLWKPLANLFSFYLGTLQTDAITTCRYNGLSLATCLLDEYCKLPQTAREWITLPRYIFERSQMSNSHVMNMLTELKRNGALK